MTYEIPIRAGELKYVHVGDELHINPSVHFDPVTRLRAPRLRITGFSNERRAHLEADEIVLVQCVEFIPTDPPAIGTLIGGYRVVGSSGLLPGGNVNLQLAEVRP